MPTQILGNNENISGGTQVIGGGTQVINRQPQVSGGTQIIGDTTIGAGATFAGGLLTKGSEISGWIITDKINIQSGEADLYIAEKNGEKGVIKYYRGHIHPKTDLLEKLVGLKHPDIINVFEYGEYNGHFYEIMEYAAGGSLDTRNEDGTYKYLPLSEEKAVQACKEIINSYKACHERGIIHRDIKPANIYYKNADGTDIVIGDFGISSIYDQDEVASHKTQTVSRTTGYAAPEVLSGIISPKMDYYALGITLWELLTGKDPFVMENGKRRNDAHLLRDTIEGRIADDLLSREPKISASMQHLIRGLLVIDENKRWGYDEITRHLSGEYVEVAKKEVSAWEYSIEKVSCTTLEQVGTAIYNNLEAKSLERDINKEWLSNFLEDKYPEISKKINDIAKEYSAINDSKLGYKKIALLLNPSIPYITPNGYKIENIDDVVNLIVNAPEEMVKVLDEKNEWFYTYFEHLGYKEKIPEIKNLIKNIEGETGFSVMLKLGKIAVLLKNNTINPFKVEQYNHIVLTDFRQLSTVPEELQDYIIDIIKNKSFDGLLLPWILTTCSFFNLNEISDWKDLFCRELSEREKMDIEKASNLSYVADKYKEAFDLIMPIYEAHKNNENVFKSYIWLLLRIDSNKALSILDSFICESIGANTAKAFIELRRNYLEAAENDIEKLEKKWPNNILVVCLKILYLLKMYYRKNDTDYLKDAQKYVEKIQNTDDEIDFSWSILVQNLLRKAKKEDFYEISEGFCKDNGLCYPIVKQTLELEFCA